MIPASRPVPDASTVNRANSGSMPTKEKLFFIRSPLSHKVPKAKTCTGDYSDCHYDHQWIAKVETIKVSLAIDTILVALQIKESLAISIRPGRGTVCRAVPEVFGNHTPAVPAGGLGKTQVHQPGDFHFAIVGENADRTGIVPDSSTHLGIPGSF